MYRLLAALLAGLLAALLPAQEPTATLQMEDGRVLTGKVLAIELGKMRLQVGQEVLTVPTTQIRSCRLEGADGVAPEADDPAGAGPGPDGGQPRAATAPGAQEPQDAAADPQPFGRPAYFRSRMAALEEVYPWLVPTMPTQWISCGLLLFAVLSLVVHLSTSVVAGESPNFGRSVFVAFWYLVTGALQMIMVPPLAFATLVMLVANPALALFWLRQLFGLSRGAAVVALAVQLGFAVVGYGLLELVSSLLHSIDPQPA
jgi:hypothetical protein